MVQFVDSNDQLPDSQSVGQQGMFSCLPFFGQTVLKFIGQTGDQKQRAVSLSGASDHVFNEVSMAWSIDDCKSVVVGLQRSQSCVDRHPSVSFAFEVVDYPRESVGPFPDQL
jgi:hypothetical protein